MKNIIIKGLSGLGILFILAVIYTIYIMTQVDNKYTGQELFDAINTYRKSINVEPLKTDVKLCDNLVERWYDISEPGNGHKGLEEWIVAEGIMNADGGSKNYTNIGEIYTKSTTPSNAIEGWVGSPGHRLVLEDQSFNVGCAYAYNGVGVVILGETK